MLEVRTPRPSPIYGTTLTSLPQFPPFSFHFTHSQPPPPSTLTLFVRVPAMKFQSVIKKPEEVCFKKTNTQVDKEVQQCLFEVKAAAAAAPASLLPVAPTPERNTEKAFFSSDSPLTWADHDPLHVAAADLDSTSPRTPKAAVFDPFAPGPGDLILAPHVKKFTIKSKIDIVRRLNFDDCKQDEEDEADIDDEEDVFLGKIYESLLDAIVAKQIEAALDEGLLAQKIGSCATPNGMPLLNGIAETCPGAPRKFRSVLKKKDLGLCRKLQF